MAPAGGRYNFAVRSDTQWKTDVKRLTGGSRYTELGIDMQSGLGDSGGPVRFLYQNMPGAVKDTPRMADASAGPLPQSVQSTIQQ